MPKLTNPARYEVRLVHGRRIPAGATVDVTDEEYESAGPLFTREEAPATRSVDARGVERSRPPRRETRKAD